MKIFNNIDGIKLKKPILTIGIFDGVHMGHKKILERVIEVAGQEKGESVVLTLWPSPRVVLGKNPDRISFLSPIKEKTELLRNTGIGNLIILPFTKELAMTPYNDFVSEILVKRIGINHMVVGYNHAFGKNREGNFTRLKEISKKLNFTAEKVDPLFIQNTKVSSTIVRKNIENGFVDVAAQMLGYNYKISGIVVKGKQMGKSIGFPTANIIPVEEKKMIPKNGVYAVMVNYRDRILKGMLNIGIRPTINENIHDRTVEVHIFDFNSEIYHENITVRFIKRIRDENKFENVSRLKERIIIDKQQALSILKMNQII